jgi:uncharacterized protein (DUF362 family)
VGGLQGRIGTGDRVLIKPNFVAPFRHATTDLAFIEHFVAEVRATGAVPVIGESSGYEFDTSAAFQVLGVNDLAARLDVELLDLGQGPFADVDLGPGVGPVSMSRAALDAQLLINLPVLKGHTITRLTGAVKNLFGLLDKSSRRHLHSRGLEAAIAAIARRFPGALHVVDARRKLLRAVFAESEPLGYVLAGTEPFALDHLGAELLGIAPTAIGHLDRVPAYEVEGDQPVRATTLTRRSSFRDRAHRATYSAFYWLDEQKAGLIGGRSVIFDLHWHLGIHPELTAAGRERVDEVAASCPVDAVDLAGRCIVKRRCERVRCLQCYRRHPDLVRLGGLNRPRRLMRLGRDPR